MIVSTDIDRDDALRLFMKLDAPLVAYDAPRKWVQIARAGNYKGHPSGAFSFDAGSFERIVANFDAQRNPVPVKYGHPDGESDGRPVPAVGWIHDLEARGDGSQLWAFVEFTADAAQLIREGKYRYCSVVVDVAAIHRETAKEIGPELLELGLVNNPFIDGMEPIRLSRTKKGIAFMKTWRDLVKEAMKDLPTESSTEQFMAYMSAKAALEKTIEGTGAAEDPAKAAAAPVEPVALAATTPPGDTPADDASQGGGGAPGGVLDALAAALGVDVAAVEGLLTERMADLVAWLKGEPMMEVAATPDAATAADVSVVANSRIGALSKQIADRDDSSKKLMARIEALEFEKVEARIDGAIKSGQLLDVERDRIVALARKAPELLDSFLSKEPAVPTGDAVQSRKATAPAIIESGSEDESFAAMHVALSAAKLLPKDPKEAREFVSKKLLALSKNRREERA